MVFKKIDLIHINSHTLIVKTLVTSGSLHVLSAV